MGFRQAVLCWGSLMDMDKPFFSPLYVYFRFSYIHTLQQFSKYQRYFRAIHSGKTDDIYIIHAATALINTDGDRTSQHQTSKLQLFYSYD
jgi:hypothetical protein